MTGSTHGIKFKISPPINAKRIILKIEDELPFVEALLEGLEDEFLPLALTSSGFKMPKKVSRFFPWYSLEKDFFMVKLFAFSGE